MPARLRTTYRHSQAGGSPRPLFFLNRIYQLCILLLLFLFLSFLHFCIAFRRLPITDSSNKEHPVGGYGHKSTHSNCPTRSDRRSSLGIGRFVTWKLLLVLVAHLLLVLLPTWHPPSFEPLPVRSNLRPTIQRARHHAARVQPHGGLKWK